MISVGALKVVLVLASFWRAAEAVTTQDITSQQWTALNTTIQGRLHTALPFAAPCFPVVNGQASAVDNATCTTIQENYLSPTFRAQYVGADTWPQFETCMSTSEQCLLDASDPSNPQAWTQFQCDQGSVSSYYIEVEEVTDVQAALNFSSSTGVTLAIRNSGHDCLGRSSIKGSLAVWTHNLDTLSYNQSFVPEGGSQSYPAITIGAGVAWAQVYAFADANNVTAIGGYHETVGASGGWLMGGGHSTLSPVYGLGVDRVLQMKVVTPDGQYQVANSYTNPDLFWALRGGGGSTFGIVMESTILVEPQLTLQVASLSLNLTSTNGPDFYKMLVENGLQWGKQGWGGNMLGNNLTLVNPLLSLEEAQDSMKNATEYVLSQNGTVTVEELPSWYAVFTKYALSSPDVVDVGAEVALASRLMPQSLFSNETGQSQVAELLADMFQYAPPSIVITPPILYNYTEGATSVTPAWRTALWHVIFESEFEFDSTLDEKQAAFDLANNFTEKMTAIAPDSGAYLNEANTYEPNFEESFWGSNYDRLLELKQQYDPNGLLDCWRCVGWKGQSDSRYQCYL